MTSEERELPNHVLYARVDQLTSYQDYAPYDLCLRMVAVDEQSFQNENFNAQGGCRTFLVDINLRHGSGAAALMPWRHYRHRSDSHVGYDLYSHIGDPPRCGWLRVMYTLARTKSDSYGYPLFRDAEPTYLEIQSITSVRGPEIARLACAHATQPLCERESSAPENLITFHVGQGMSSVLQCGERTYLLDAGAGTPVKRESYKSGTHLHGGKFANELMATLGNSQVRMVLSHPDSDHWRLLDWDAGLLKKVEKIYVPDDLGDLALCDSAIKPLVVPTKWLQVSDNTGCIFLEAHRSDPDYDDSNGQCLVSEIVVNGSRALLPGDYVYERMSTDKNLAVVALTGKAYDAVVVPHHGDKRSGAQVVKPVISGKSTAFFSAGNHLGYHHPRSESLTAHYEAGFSIVSKKWLDNIVAVTLI